jgi:hypothetical protein
MRRFALLPAFLILTALAVSAGAQSRFTFKGTVVDTTGAVAGARLWRRRSPGRRLGSTTFAITLTWAPHHGRV